MMKKIIKKIMKVLGILLAIALVIAGVIYFTVLRYPNLKENPTVGKWYRLDTAEMKDSEGNEYHAFIKKGSENKVMIYFAGGGVSINEQTARNDTYNTKLVWPDMLANLTMNMGGLAVEADVNPFNDWTIILFPYATGDFHSGAGEFVYTDKDGKEKTLYHNGYINFTSAMDLALEKAGIQDTDTVIVTGYSAGGWAASILANDVFTKYFPDAENKTLFVDGSYGLNDDWHDIAENVWHSPEHIVNRITSDNIILDSIKALQTDVPEAKILFACTTRDGSLAQVQRYFNDLVIDDKTGEMPVDEKDGDAFQVSLKNFVAQLQDIGVHCFIYDGYDWYDEGATNLTSHTIIAAPYVWEKLNDTNKSIGEWLNDAVNGILADYGIELLDKVYE